MVVGSSGLEPPTSRLSGVCSNQLSYEPIVVETKRVELLTSCLQGRRSSQLSYAPTLGLSAELLLLDSFYIISSANRYVKHFLHFF